MNSILRLINNKYLYEREKAIIRYNRSSVRWMRQPTVKSMDETLLTIKQRRASIARYGDGEFDLICGRTEGYQKNDPLLSKRLQEILLSNSKSDRFFVGIPDCFGDLSQFNDAAQRHWRIRLEKERVKWVRLMDTRNPYYNSQITRFYFDWAQKDKCKTWLAELKNIWNQENILLVEGDKSRLGVGNDLFDNAKSLRRILCPSENAFDRYDEILSSIEKYAEKNDLIMLALGPTATVLAYDLFKSGYWAFDVGHIDIEYEWMKQQAVEKVTINGKYVNEVIGGDVVENSTDEKYFKEIIAKVAV